jgi:signal transduction histidine kinase
VRELRDVADGIASLASDLERAQDERAGLLRALADRERLAGLGRVAAGVAHEVRNPLASIKLRADLAHRSKDIPERVREDLREISSEVSRLDRLVADLLVVSGRKAGPRVKTELGMLVQKRMALLDLWAKERGVDLVAEGSGEGDVDPDAIARAVDNLLRNAVEAASEGTEVHARVEAKDHRVAITVSDPGPGVPPERERELFEPFFTTKPDGTGLGLALSRSVAQAHGGSLEYSRAQGRTCFTIVLPTHANPEMDSQQ